MTYLTWFPVFPDRLDIIQSKILEKNSCDRYKEYNYWNIYAYVINERQSLIESLINYYQK
jgi:hypothetical protein